MRILLPLVPIIVMLAVFGLLVWLAAGIARVEEYRSDDDRRMIAAIKRLEQQEAGNRHDHT
jgi:uncharacterized integral membrane protein